MAVDFFLKGLGKNKDDLKIVLTEISKENPDVSFEQQGGEYRCRFKTKDKCGLFYEETPEGIEAQLSSNAYFTVYMEWIIYQIGMRWKDKLKVNDPTEGDMKWEDIKVTTIPDI